MLNSFFPLCLNCTWYIIFTASHFFFHVVKSSVWNYLFFLKHLCYKLSRGREDLSGVNDLGLFLVFIVPQILEKQFCWICSPRIIPLPGPQLQWFEDTISLSLASVIAVKSSVSLTELTLWIICIYFLFLRPCFKTRVFVVVKIHCSMSGYGFLFIPLFRLCVPKYEIYISSTLKIFQSFSLSLLPLPLSLSLLLNPSWLNNRYFQCNCMSLNFVHCLHIVKIS